MSSWLTVPLAGTLASLAVLLAEIGARSWIRRRGKYFVWAPRRRTYQRLHARSLPSLPPLARFEANADGERGDPAPERPLECYRVIVLGASSTECRPQPQATSSTSPPGGSATISRSPVTSRSVRSDVRKSR